MERRKGSRLRTIGAFIVMGTDYWLCVYPAVRRELRQWRECALRITDPTVRAQALASLDHKRQHAEGAAAFALLSPRRRRRTVIRFLVAFQVMYDYLDTVSERPTANPYEDTLQLHAALADALMPDLVAAAVGTTDDHLDDGGYLASLVETCRICCSFLPAFPLIAPAVRSAARVAIQSQGYNHAIPAEADDFTRAVVEPWASAEGGSRHGLAWWEVVGATGSSLAILVLVAASANPALQPAESAAIHDVYSPWTGAVLALVDSLVDQVQDQTTNTHSLVARYASIDVAGERLALFVQRAISRAGATARPEWHAIVVASIVALFAASPEAREPPASEAFSRALGATGQRGSLPLRLLRARERVRSWRSTRPTRGA